MLLGAAGLIGFYIYESFFANFPLLPLKLFHNSTTIITYFVTFLHGVVLWSMVYYLPIYFLSVFWYTPIIAGVAGLPQTLTVVPSAMVVGLVATKTGRYVVFELNISSSPSLEELIAHKLTDTVGASGLAGHCPH